MIYSEGILWFCFRPLFALTFVFVTMRCLIASIAKLKESVEIEFESAVGIELFSVRFLA